MLQEIQLYFKENNVASYRYSQFEKAYYQQLVSSFDEISVFSKSLREDLQKKIKFSSLFLIESYKAGNTIKFVFKTKENQVTESVLMLHKDGRKTVCVSCQIFCAVGCKFCATGANKFQRSLFAEEIVEQVLFVARYLKHKDEKVTNIVFMGMGEPFLAYNQVVEAIKVLKDPNKFGLGARHITVSTSGIVPKIYSFTDENLKVRFAISLHAPNDKLRTELMPINKVYPLKDLLAACDYYVQKTNKRISYEYVLIKNVNDRVHHANELGKLLKDKLAHVNLLIYNPHEFASYQKPEKEDVLRFRDILKQKNIEVSIRKSMGDDISGACGQLSGKIIRKGEEKEYFAEASS